MNPTIDGGNAYVSVAYLGDTDENGEREYFCYFFVFIKGWCRSEEKLPPLSDPIHVNLPYKMAQQSTGNLGYSLNPVNK